MKSIQKRHLVILPIVLLSLLLSANSYANNTKAEAHFSKVNPEFSNYLEKSKKGSVQQTWQGYSLGLVPSIIDWSNLEPVNIKSKLKTEFPTSYDLREQGKLTVPKHQLTCGACWAFAAIASLESLLMPSHEWDFSENHPNNKHGFDLPFCQGGTRDMTTAYFTRMNGPVLESDDPYDPSTPTSPDVNPTVQQHVTDVHYLPGKRGSGESYAYNNDVIKWAVMEFGGVQTNIFMGVDSGEYYHDGFDSFYNPGDSENSYGGSHAVMIVGWDDDFPSTRFRKVADGDGAYIVKNSWGTDWGEQGYFYVSYYDIRLGRTITTYGSRDNNDMTMYMYDPLGATGSFGFGYDSTDWGANIFTASKTLPIASVGFYTMNSNTEFEVYIYKNVTNSPTDGTLINTTTGTVDFAGYHTIPLSETGLIIDKDDKFSVVVKFTTPNETNPIPIEERQSGFSSQARANSGESFVSEDGVEWTDMTMYESTANVCIRALFIGCLEDSDCSDDGISCTDAVCNGHLGCSHVIKEDNCLINNNCISEYVENPNSTCMQCDPTISQEMWSDKPENSSCDDGENCTKADSCKSGVCTGTSYSCDDNLDCTTNVCNGSGGCDYSLKQDFCLISTECYTSGSIKPGDVCHTCSPSKSTSAWSESTSSTSCNDDNACTKNDYCNGGLCVGGEDIVCTDNNECTAGSCDPIDGCSFTNVADATPCREDDGVFNCFDGECVQTGCIGTCSIESTSCIDDDTVCSCNNGSWSELSCDTFCEGQGRKSKGCNQIGVGENYGCSCGDKIDSPEEDGDVEPIEDGDVDSGDNTVGSGGENGGGGCSNTSSSGSLLALILLAGMVFRRRRSGDVA